MRQKTAWTGVPAVHWQSKHWDKQYCSRGLSLFEPHLSAKVKEPSLSAGTFIKTFTFRNSSVLCCPEEGNEKFYLAGILRTCLWGLSSFKLVLIVQIESCIKFTTNE